MVGIQTGPDDRAAELDRGLIDQLLHGPSGKTDREDRPDTRLFDVVPAA